MKFIKSYNHEGREVIIHPEQVVSMTEAVQSSQWHGIRSLVRTTDGQAHDLRHSVQELLKQLEPEPPAPEVVQIRVPVNATHLDASGEFYDMPWRPELYDGTAGIWTDQGWRTTEIGSYEPEYRLVHTRILGRQLFITTPKQRAGRIYIAGPMSGIEDHNFPAFNQAERGLEDDGYTPVNPATHGVVPGAEWSDYLRADLAGLATCEGVFFLPGWSKSKGAMLEHYVAQALGLTLCYHPDAERPA